MISTKYFIAVIAVSCIALTLAAELPAGRKLKCADELHLNACYLENTDSKGEKTVYVEGCPKGKFCRQTKLDVSDRVRFLGNRYDIPQLMNYADVAILSSHWEGFGLAIIEGMAAGKPAIACDIEGVREIVNGYGLLFKQGDEKDLAKHIKSLLGDSQFYQEIAAKCKSRAKDFDINVMVEKFIHLYKEVLND